MCYLNDGTAIKIDANSYNVAVQLWGKYYVEVIPCWSTQALLDEIPYQVVNAVEEDLTLHIEKEELQYHLRYENECTGASYEIETETYDDLIDACFEMIVKLKEKDLI